MRLFLLRWKGQIAVVRHESRHLARLLAARHYEEDTDDDDVMARMDERLDEIPADGPAEVVWDITG